MPVTINVNMMTVSHKGSMGTSIAFPDVCKTPSPAGPIPIPYPNVAMSSDTTSGSKTVKMDGNEIMLKGANMKMSTGDEAGVAMGVMSNKIKGKAEFLNYSFDVKVDGQNVCRLADPTQQNMGSSNVPAPVHVQPPLPVMNPDLEGCKALAKKQSEKKIDKDTVWNNAGIWKDHRPKIQKVVDDIGVIIYFRWSNHWCADKFWIRDKHKPKPHEVLNAKTIAEKNVQFVNGWMSGVGTGGRKGKFSAHKTWKGPPRLPLDPTELYGVVMSLDAGELGKPMKGYGMASNGDSYEGKWITGDYDLQDIMFAYSDCIRPFDDEHNAEVGFGKIRRALNKAMGWDGIQHGPQAQWAEAEMPMHVKKWLNDPPGTTYPLAGGKVATAPQVRITPDRMLNVCDEKLTVVAPKGKVLQLDSHEEIKNALICCSCGEEK